MCETNATDVKLLNIIIHNILKKDTTVRDIFIDELFKYINTDVSTNKNNIILSIISYLFGTGNEIKEIYRDKFVSIFRIGNLLEFIQRDKEINNIDYKLIDLYMNDKYV